MVWMWNVREEGTEEDAQVFGPTDRKDTGATDRDGIQGSPSTYCIREHTHTSITPTHAHTCKSPLEWCRH